MSKNTVYIARSTTRGSSGVYHTERCQYVGDSHTTTTLEDATERGFEECSVCSGDIDRVKPNHSHLLSAITAGNSSE